MYQRHHPIVLLSLYFLAACSQLHRKAEVPAVYNEGVLWDFVRSAASQSKAVRLQSLDSVLSLASKDSFVFRQTATYLTQIYSNPNSPLREEYMFDKLLKTEFNSAWYSPREKMRFTEAIHLLHQNDIGITANDFEYTTPEGRKKHLYDLHADYTLIYFYNPECEACREMKSALVNSEPITKATEAKKLILICIYIDTDLQTWYSHLGEFPCQWFHGRDSNEYLLKNNVFDLRAIPTLYLLNREKKVVLKDCTSIDEIEDHLAF